MTKAPWRKGVGRSGGPADRPLDERGEDAAPLEDGAGGRDVDVDPDAAAPDREHAADDPQESLLPGPVEAGRAAPQGPDARLGGDGVEGQEGVHPAAVDGGEQEVAAAGREVLATARVHAEPEHAHQQDAGQHARQPEGDPCPDRGRLPEPVEALADVPPRPADLVRPDVRVGPSPPRPGHSGAAGGRRRPGATPRPAAVPRPQRGLRAGGARRGSPALRGRTTR